ncbi:MAG: hypothetical protein ACRECJ_03220, partial [Limisphaerales bacterium]
MQGSKNLVPLQQPEWRLTAIPATAFKNQSTLKNEVVTPPVRIKHFNGPSGGSSKLIFFTSCWKGAIAKKELDIRELLCY